MKTPLRHLAHARAGDKGTTLTLSVHPFDPAFYGLLCREVTADVVAAKLGARVTTVTRRELPSAHMLLFECHRQPGDSVTTSLWLDAHGKALSSLLLDLEVDADLAALAAATRRADVPIVALAEGCVRGRRIDSGVLCYSGIPFAAPPVGPWRFRPPQPVTPWEGVLDATQFPPAPLSAMGTAIHVSEDCLYLNVWTPSTGGRHPVLVWLYGGGFELGSASPPYTDGARLTSRGAVVVAANYRVGALGFAHLADIGGAEWAESTNLGHQDQVAALRWVRSRIDAFGGDSRNVTVFGESAGGFSIGAMLAMPSAAGLFDKAIMSSGCTTRVYPRDVATEMAKDLLATLGATSVGDLLAAPAERILQAQSKVISRDVGQRNTPGGRAWGSVLDGVILPEHPHESVRAGKASHIPLIVGSTKDEVQLFEILFPDAASGPITFAAPATEQELLDEMGRCAGSSAAVLLAAYRAQLPKAGLARLRSRFLTDWIYRIPAQLCASAQAEAGGAAWLYLFSWGPPELGAAHGIDVDFVFDRLDDKIAADPGATAVRDEIIRAWLAFASDGNPGWPPHDPRGGTTTRDFGGTTPLTAEPPAATRDLWKMSDRSADREDAAMPAGRAADNRYHGVNHKSRNPEGDNERCA